AGQSCVLRRVSAGRGDRSAGRQHFGSHAAKVGTAAALFPGGHSDGAVLFPAARASGPEGRAVRLVPVLLLPDAHVAEILRNRVRSPDARVDARLRRADPAFHLSAAFRDRGRCERRVAAVCGILPFRARPEFSQLERFKLGEALHSAFANRPFVILLVATTLAIMAINIPTVLLRFLAKYWAHDENAAAQWLIAYFAGSILSYPFWFRITIQIEKKPAFVVAIACNAVGSLVILLLSPGNRLAMLALMVFSGFSAIGIWVTQMSAAADVIEWDEERTGRRQEGAYGGLTSMAMKIAIAVSMVLVGQVMGWIGYTPGANNLAPQAVQNLKTLFAIAPAAIYAIGAIVFSGYPITRESHRQLRERLSERSTAPKSLAS